MSADMGRRMLLFGRWLLESLIKLLVGWVRFLVGSRRSFGVGVVAAVLLVAADEIPGPKGTPAIDQLPTNVLYAITVLELFIYDMRHVQHHVGQLQLLLRQRTDSAPAYVGRGREA